MSAGIKLEGADKLIAAFSKLSKEAQEEAGKAVQATAIEVRGNIVKRYQKGPASGKVYTRGNVKHQASAPGEAPATDTGRLASGTEYRMTGTMSAEVGNNVQYGPWLEFGTQNIAPRPAWRPEVLEAQPKFLQRMETALARVMQK